METATGGPSAEAILKSIDGQYFLIDVCANLANKKFARDVDGVIQRAKDAGIKKIIVPTASIQNTKDTLRLTGLFPNYVYCTAGIHPYDARFCNDESFSKLKEIASSSECVAIGLCGLDCTKTFSDIEEQKRVFEKQVLLAIEEKKPLLIYEKEAQASVLEILNKYKNTLPVVVIHAFSGNKEQVQKYLDLECYICLTGSLWKDKSEDGIRKILEDNIIPLDKLVVATDSPFMYPNTRSSSIPSHIRNSLTEKSLSFLHKYCTFQRNEPCSLPTTVEVIAAYYKLKPDEVALKTSYCALKIFGLC